MQLYYFERAVLDLGFNQFQLKNERLKFIDAKTGQELASFKDQEAGGFFGSQDLGGFEGKFPAFVGRVATLSTDFIEKLYN